MTTIQKYTSWCKKCGNEYSFEIEFDKLYEFKKSNKCKNCGFYYNYKGEE